MARFHHALRVVAGPPTTGTVGRGPARAYRRRQLGRVTLDQHSDRRRHQPHPGRIHLRGRRCLGRVQLQKERVTRRKHHWGRLGDLPNLYVPRLRQLAEPVDDVVECYSSDSRGRPARRLPGGAAVRREWSGRWTTSCRTRLLDDVAAGVALLVLSLGPGSSSRSTGSEWRRTGGETRPVPRRRAVAAPGLPRTPWSLSR